MATNADGRRTVKSARRHHGGLFFFFFFGSDRGRRRRHGRKGRHERPGGRGGGRGLLPAEQSMVSATKLARAAAARRCRCCGRIVEPGHPVAVLSRGVCGRLTLNSMFLLRGVGNAAHALKRASAADHQHCERPYEEDCHKEPPKHDLVVSVVAGSINLHHQCRQEEEDKAVRQD